MPNVNKYYRKYVSPNILPNTPIEDDVYNTNLDLMARGFNRLPIYPERATIRKYFFQFLNSPLLIAYSPRVPFKFSPVTNLWVGLRPPVGFRFSFMITRPIEPLAPEFTVNLVTLQPDGSLVPGQPAHTEGNLAFLVGNSRILSGIVPVDKIEVGKVYNAVVAESSNDDLTVAAQLVSGNIDSSIMVPAPVDAAFRSGTYLLFSHMSAVAAGSIINISVVTSDFLYSSAHPGYQQGAVAVGRYKVISPGLPSRARPSLVIKL